MAANCNNGYGAADSNGKAKIGLWFYEDSNTATSYKFHVDAWIHTKWAIHDSDNGWYWNVGTSSSLSATTKYSARSIYTTVSSGSGWSSSNEQKIDTGTYTYTKGHSAFWVYVAIKLTDVYGCGTMTHRGYIQIPAKTSYTITYNANGGSGAPGKGTKWYGEAYTVSSTKPTRTGYTFSNWTITATGNKVAAGGTISADSNANYTLSANWTANSYNVTFNPNGGSGGGTRSETYAAKYTLPANPTRTGYTFAGWFTAASGGTQVTTSTTVAITGAQTLYAHWTANTYTVAFNKNATAATGTMANESFSYGTAKALTANAFTWQYHQFLGWATSTTGAVTYTDGQSVSNLATSGTKTLYAVWKELYLEPTVNIVEVYRASDTTGTFSDDGNYMHISIAWSVDTRVYSGNTAKKLTIQYKAQNATSYTSLYTATISGVSGSHTYNSSSAILTNESSYDIKVTVEDDYGSSTSVGNISLAYFTVDFLSGGHGIGFGCPASAMDTLRCAMLADFTGGITDESLLSASTITLWKGILGIT